MDVVLLLLRLILTLVFGVAGIAKLADLEGSREAVAGFGVPRILAGPIGTLLPLFELAAAFALLTPPSAWYGAILALLLLLAFIAGMSLSLARGEAPNCHCFGQIHSEPVGRSTLIRNIVLAALAGFVVLTGRENAGLSLSDWFAGLAALQQLIVAVSAVVVLVLAVEGYLAYRLRQGNAQLRERLRALESGESPGNTTPGLPVGSPAPEFALRDLEGRTVTLDALLAGGRAAMLLFVDPNCAPCSSLMPDIARWQREYAEGMTFALVSTGKVKANRAKVEEHGVSGLLLQKKVEVAQAYKFGGTPSGVIVHPSGTIGSPLAVGTDEIRALLDQYMEMLAEQAGVELEDEGEYVRALRKAAEPLEIGAPAPDLELSGLDGSIVRNADLRGRDAVLLFWSPSCPFCHEMRPDLWEWEASRSDRSPQLLLVVSDESQAGMVKRFRSPVLIDRDRAVAEALHGNATPTAVKIDAEGRIASQPLVGAAAVFELLGAPLWQRERVPA